MLLDGLLHLYYAQHVSGTYMPIIRSSRLYLCYYRIWCVMPRLLVVGGQVHSSSNQGITHHISARNMLSRLQVQ